MMETLSGIKLMDSFDPQLIAGFDEIWDAAFHYKWQPIYQRIFGCSKTTISSGLSCIESRDIMRVMI